MRISMPVLGLLVGGILAACGGSGAFPSVNPAPLGQIIPGAGGDPDVECRAIQLDRCTGIAEQVILDDIDPANIERVIVSCEGAPCTLADGAFRIDTVDLDGTPTEIGRGTYGEGVQPEAPPTQGG
jgi:hypothetical protein